MITVSKQKSRTLFSILIAGMVLGALEITFVVAYTVPLFSGQLSEFLTQGIGLVLLGSIVSLTAVSALSSNKTTMSAPQDIPTVLLVVMTTSVVGIHSSSTGVTEVTFFTILAIMSSSALLTASVMLVMGFIKLGKVTRYIPYPVVGGLLAGTGWLLIVLSLEMMTNIRIGFSNVEAFFETEILVRWLPGLVIAVLLIWVQQGFKSPLAIPAVLLTGFIIYHVVLLSVGMSVEDAKDNGFLLDISGDKLSFGVSMLEVYEQADWNLVKTQIPVIISLCILASIVSLVQVSAIEVAVDKELEMDRELIANGFANTLVGLFGGIVSYHNISATVLAYRFKIISRLVGFFTAAVCFLPFLLGSSWLGYFPIPVLAGLILYLGIDFFHEWIVNAWRRLPVWEYAIVIVISAVSVNYDFPTAIVVGMICGAILFLVRYSHFGVAHKFISGSNCRSAMMRSELEEVFLSSKPNAMVMLQLKGFLFFGTSNNLYESIKLYVSHNNQALEILLLDFSDVPNIDSTAIMGLSRIRRLLDQKNITLLTTAVSEGDRKMVYRALIGDEQETSLKVTNSADAALEVGEDILLMSLSESEISELPSLRNNLHKENWGNDEIEKFYQYLDKIELKDGDYLIRIADNESDAFLIESGLLEVTHLRNGKNFRLRVYTPGMVVGEMAIYTRAPRTADVISKGEAIVYELTEHKITLMETEHPHIAIKLHKYFAKIMATKITDDMKLSNIRK
jgi:SulP family sulfate permease